jgi:cell division protein FtsZ
MEVDEAASHIKELVDPDANIIWGSAFNDGLEGRIRVSVVATGIEAEAVPQAQPAKVFTFPARAAAPAPVAESEPAPETESAEDDDEVVALDLSSDEQNEDSDELLLDSDDILTTPVGSAPIAPPADEDETASDESNEQSVEQPKAATGTGGTLFERMSSIARGAPRAQIEEDQPSGSFRREPIDIPRFLNRQNNQ